MNLRSIILLTLVMLGLVIAMVPENTTKPYKLTAAEMMSEIQYAAEMVPPDDLANWLINGDPTIQLIDVRTPDEYAKFHLDGALNIPFADLLNEEYADVTDQGTMMNIFYSNGSLQAHEAWMVLRQLGYQNNYVLQGGLNYWFDTIMNPTEPAVTSPDEEIAKYEFRKGASGFFGGGNSEVKTADTQSEAKRPPIKRKAKKAAPQGGC